MGDGAAATSTAMGLRLRLKELPSVGVSVEGVGAAELLEIMEEDYKRELVPERDDGSAGNGDDSNVLKMLSDALRSHSLLWFHADSEAAGTAHSLTPFQIRRINLLLHKAAYPRIELLTGDDTGDGQVDEAAGDAMAATTGAAPGEPPNLRGHCFPGFPESAVLGFAEIADYHGLSGSLSPRSWWERVSGELHHDGAFSARCSSVPQLVSMYCEESTIQHPKGSTTMRCWDSGEELVCPAASTLFYLTGRALAQPGAEETIGRARRMRCVYRDGFGRVRQGQYPRMSASYLTALEPPRGPKEDREHTSITEFATKTKTHWLAADTFSDCAKKDIDQMERDIFRHSLVQRDDDGRESIVITWTCLDCLEELDERGEWQALEYEDARLFIERLLSPAAKPPHILVVDWKPGDLVLWNNLSIQHSVTPTDVYAFAPNRRLIVRTAFEPVRT